MVRGCCPLCTVNDRLLMVLDTPAIVVTMTSEGPGQYIHHKAVVDSWGTPVQERLPSKGRYYCNQCNFYFAEPKWES